MKFFYIRVSSKEQNEARQLEQAHKLEIPEKCIYIDKESGKDFNRPKWQALTSILRIGDELIISDLSRLSRNREDIKNCWKMLRDKGVNITVLNMPILNTKQYTQMEGMGQLISDIVFELLSWMVEEERIRIKTNQKAGIKEAKKKGVYKGRPQKYHENAVGSDKLVYDAIIESLNSNISIKELSIKLGISRTTIYKIKNEINL
ncbi:recombinase family protein [Enterococcus plantarum]|uniref:recombinase family protein n=1 Tax=Enterococcus plantarum TaxID=1077675 RepID=UPI001A8F4242|nr:recombinase family protein [Enterococcus plantarum]MBO0421453.1 recombinase family protein [Enterococcus plantarum]